MSYDTGTTVQYSFKWQDTVPVGAKAGAENNNFGSETQL